MKQAIGREELSTLGYELRLTFTGTLRLYVKVRVLDWDTNTGFTDGIYTIWRRCNREETREWLRNKEKGE